MRAHTFRRLAVSIRWLAIGWIVVAYLVPPLLPGGVAEWDDFFDDAFLIGAVPGTLGLLLPVVGLHLPVSRTPSEWTEAMH